MRQLWRPAAAVARRLLRVLFLCGASLHSDYYRGQRAAATEAISARPSFFLTLGRESHFTFAVASRSRNSDAVEQGAEWLAQALQTLGVGAKTSAGYGFWVIDGGA